MQVEIALRMWQRSIEVNKLRYTTMLCDGDSKSYDAVVYEKPYGDEITIEKEDCTKSMKLFHHPLERSLYQFSIDYQTLIY